MTNFEKYFRVVKVVPTIVHNPKHGKIDLRALTVDLAKKLIEDDFPYLELTPEGKAKLYPPPPPPPPATAKEIIDEIKKSDQRVEVLKLISENSQFASVKAAGEKRLKQLDNNPD